MVKPPAVYCPGIKYLFEIMKFRKSDKLTTKKAPLHPLLDELLMDSYLKKGCEATRWRAKPRDDLERATRDFISDLFSGAVEAMIHAKQVMRRPRDLHLGIRMRGSDEGILDGWTPGKPKP